MKHEAAKKGLAFVEVMIIAVIIALLAFMAIPAVKKVRTTSQERMVRDNLSEFVEVAQRYLEDKGVSEVIYEELVSAGLINLKQVADEDYGILVLNPETTHLSVVIGGRDVTYDF